MSNLDVIKFLLAEIEEEQKLLAAVKTDEDQARKKAEAEAKRTGEEKYYWKYLEYEGRWPHKKLVEDNLRKIRKLALKEMKGR